MLNIFDQIEEWIKDFLIECIIGNLTGLFDEVNTKVGEIADQVGTTPQDWNSGIFSRVCENFSAKMPSMIFTDKFKLPILSSLNHK